MNVLRGCMGVLVMLLIPRVYGEATLTQILTNGPTDKRINIVFLSEGYLAGQTNLFASDVRAVLTNILHTPPFDGYINYFNAFTIFVASVDAGSDHPASHIYKDTYFNSTYDSYGIDRLITIPPNDRDASYSNGEGKVYELLQNFLPDYDLSVLIVNDTTYGGSGGSSLIASANDVSPEIVVHELGHNYAALGDEYDLAAPGYPETEEPNTTRETIRSAIKWRDWILDETPIPTPEIWPYASVVGLFEGAHYHTNDWYRPKLDCKMKTLGVAFCEVCAEALVTSTYALVRPIESWSPSTNSFIKLVETQSMTFAITRLQPTRYDLTVQWFTNGIAVSGATNTTFHLAAADLPTGANEVRVEVTDPTPKVRTDPLHYLKDRRSWRVGSPIEPILEARRWEDKIVLSWPATSAMFSLECRTNFKASTSWVPCEGSDPPVLVSNRFTVTNLITGGSMFYRLRK